MTDSTIRHIATVFPVNAEALRPDPKRHGRVSIVREFSLNTSAHGIPSIARSESIHNRIFWSISFVCFTGILIYFIIASIKAYFQYPTQTSVSFVDGGSQPFPAVTICNYAPIRFDVFIKPFLNYTNSLNLTNTNDTSTINFIQASYIRDYFQSLFNSGATPTNYLFSINTMLIACSYNDVGCDANDFIPFLSSTYGRCYTFNAKMKLNDSSVRSTTDSGGSGHFQLRLYAQSHQYVPYVTEDVSAGMVAMIHDNTELPLIDIAGIQLAPGRRHKLSYKKRTNQLMPSPYTQCTDKVPLVMQAMFDRYQGADYAYSQVICNLLCIQAYAYQECNCVNPDLWTARSVVLPGTNTIIEAPICNATDTCYTNASARITNTESIWNQFCSDCEQACSTVDFTVTTSSVSAPSTPYAYITKGFVEASTVPLPDDWSTAWQSEVQQNYVALDVVCESTLVETYTQSASLSGVDVLSNVGGQTGLWIGISFLSLMEIVEMLYRLIRYQCCLLRRKRGKREENENHEEL